MLLDQVDHTRVLSYCLLTHQSGSRSESAAVLRMFTMTLLKCLVKTDVKAADLKSLFSDGHAVVALEMILVVFVLFC